MSFGGCDGLHTAWKETALLSIECRRFVLGISERYIFLTFAELDAFQNLGISPRDVK